MSDHEIRTAKADVLRQLKRIKLDKYGTPDRKLPNCPRCCEDELYASLHSSQTVFRCYRCAWSSNQ